jgi:predicted nucleic acid-binding protein
MIFVDTGAWVARFSRRDQFHNRAIETWENLWVSGEPIVTSDSVFAETVSMLVRRIGPSSGVQTGRFLHGWSELTILRATREDETTALDLLAKFADQSVGFVDCLSFALMRRHGISVAFSFDRHFELAGFSLLR